MKNLILLFVLMVATVGLAQAAQPNIPPGQYVLDGDSGTLTIRPDTQNRQKFEIETIGGNCHSCSVTGVITGGIGHADSWAEDGSDSKCRIAFSADRTSVSVRPITEEECRAYCGMRAGFAGTYRVPPAACTRAGRQKQRDQFLRQYRAKQYADATKTLESLVAQCEKSMSWIEVDQVRNDLALAQYHSGNAQQCLATLNATLAAQAKDGEELKSGNGKVYLPPCDFDNYIGVAKSTWFNQALCAKAIGKKR